MGRRDCGRVVVRRRGRRGRGRSRDSGAAWDGGAAAELTTTCATQGATIHFTTDTRDPTTESPIFASPNTLLATTTVKVRATKAGLAASAAAAETFGPLGATQTPYRGLPAPFPGRVEAEDYDHGGEGVAYHDTDPTNAGGA